MLSTSQIIGPTVLIALLCFPGISCGATTYIVTNLGDFPGGFDESNAYALNSLGQVVGWSEGGIGAASYQHAFLWTPSVPNGTSGSMQDLGGIGGFPGTSFAYGINSYGQVVGDSDNAAFLWTPDTPNGTAGNMNRLPNLAGGTGSGRAVRHQFHGAGRWHQQYKQWITRVLVDAERTERKGRIDRRSR